jgi:hypothetical protein
MTSLLLSRWRRDVQLAQVDARDTVDLLGLTTLAPDSIVTM